ncbi:MAG TPA: Wzz/FepE/Etk N-terminal domain-containing protein, partial [Caldilineaceae bacterium]|nr:Wzz/FepE/Etk N-terminal domain-containing protein [Caldilineaceae bacterium]
MIEQLDLTAYLRPLLRWWWLLVAAMLVAMVSSFFYTSSQPAIYTARATIMVGSSIKDPNPNGAEFYLAGQLAAAYADIAGRAPLYQATKEALNMPWLPAYSIAQIAGGPVIEVLVYDGDPQRAYMVADELVKQVIALGPQEEQSRQAFIDQQLTKLQDSITQTEATIAQRENELLNIDSARELANQQAEIKALQEKASSLQQNYA